MSLLAALKTPNRPPDATPAKRDPPKPAAPPPTKRQCAFRFDIEGEETAPTLKAAELWKQAESQADLATSSTAGAKPQPQSQSCDSEPDEEREIEEHRIVLKHPSLGDSWKHDSAKPPQRGDWKCKCGMWNFKMRHECYTCKQRRSRDTEVQVAGMLPDWLREFLGENLAGWPLDIPNHVPTVSVCLKDEAALTQYMASDPPWWNDVQMVWWAEKAQRFQDACTMLVVDCPAQCPPSFIFDYYTDRIPECVVHQLEKFTTDTFCCFDVEFSSPELRDLALKLPPPCTNAALHTRDRDREVLLEPCPPFCTDAHVREHFQKLGPTAIASILPRESGVKLVTFRLQAQMQQALAAGPINKLGPFVVNPIQMHRLLTSAQDRARRLQCVGLPQDSQEETVRSLFAFMPPYCIESVVVKDDHATVTFLDHDFAKRALRATENRMPGTINVSYCEKYDWNLQTLAIFRLPPGMPHADIRRFYRERLNATVHVEYVVHHKVRHIHFDSVEAANAALQAKLPPDLFGYYTTVEASIARRQMLEILDVDSLQAEGAGEEAALPTDNAAEAATSAEEGAAPPTEEAELTDATEDSGNDGAEKVDFQPPVPSSPPSEGVAEVAVASQAKGRGERPKAVDATQAAQPTQEKGKGSTSGKEVHIHLDLNQLPDNAGHWKALSKDAKANKEQPIAKAAELMPPTTTCEVIPDGSMTTVKFHCTKRSGLDRVAEVLDIQWALQDDQWVGRGRVQWTLQANEDFARVHKDLLKLEAKEAEGAAENEDSDAESSDSSRFSD